MKSASQINYEQMQMDLAYNMLAEHPYQQAERIAKHYVAHATIALQILELLKHKGESKDIELCAERLVNEIKRNHRHDFGIDLEWHIAGTTAYQCGDILGKKHYT